MCFARIVVRWIVITSFATLPDDRPPRSVGRKGDVQSHDPSANTRPGIYPHLNQLVRFEVCARSKHNLRCRVLSWQRPRPQLHHDLSLTGGHVHKSGRQRGMHVREVCTSERFARQRCMHERRHTGTHERRVDVIQDDVTRRDANCLGAVTH